MVWYASHTVVGIGYLAVEPLSVNVNVVLSYCNFLSTQINLMSQMRIFHVSFSVLAKLSTKIECIMERKMFS